MKYSNSKIQIVLFTLFLSSLFIISSCNDSKVKCIPYQDFFSLQRDTTYFDSIRQGTVKIRCHKDSIFILNQKGCKKLSVIIGKDTVLGFFIMYSKNSIFTVDNFPNEIP